MPLSSFRINDQQALAETNPYLLLAANVFYRAMKDYHSEDLIKALDAFVWLVEVGPKWFGLMGYPIDSDSLFKKVVSCN
jgi:hypothetical protein